MKRLLCILVVAAIYVMACKKDNKTLAEPTVTTSPLTSITSSSATAGGIIISDGGNAITASGIVLSRIHGTPTLSDTVISGTITSGSFTVNLSNLDFGTVYFIRAFATNNIGTGYGSVMTLSTVNDTSKVRFTYNGQTVTYGIIVSPTSGRKWMDRDLGASRVATMVTDTSAYGHWFQWGRLGDGHQLRSSGTVNTQSLTDIPGHSNIIVTFPDWRNPSKESLWQGSSGVNNPCPAGWHVPSRTEWEAETSINDTTSGYNVLKLTAGGFRECSAAAGLPQVVGTRVYYWTSTSTADNAIFYRLGSVKTTDAGRGKSAGMCIRCIMDK